MDSQANNLDNENKEKSFYGEIEDFIRNNESKGSIDTCFSPKYIESEKKAWDKVFSSLEQNFIVFALEGYSNYGYYRALNGHIYMIELNLGKLDSFQLIE